MHARVTTYEGSPVPAGGDVSRGGERALRQVRELPGFRGLYLMIDRATGRVLSMTLWEDEAAMGAAEAEGARIREEYARLEGERVLDVERYEVGFRHLEE
jgi:heme-degrading monooxygenase HmoA